MILNKLLFGIILFCALYYFSDRKDMSWAAYGVAAYVVLLIALDYMKQDNNSSVNNQLMNNIKTLQTHNNDYLRKQNDLKTEYFQNKLKEENPPPVVKFMREPDKLPMPFNEEANHTKLLPSERDNCNKLNLLNQNENLDQYFKSDLNNIEVCNSGDGNMGLALGDSEAYKYNVNNQLFYSMF